MAEADHASRLNPLTLDWLTEQTLWPRDRLQDLADTLTGAWNRADLNQVVTRLQPVTEC